MSALPWWLLPAGAALILVATHTYLGLHVISRNVFFVDLALAQVAALGSSVAFLYGFALGDSVTYYVSLLFAAAAAWFFSVTRMPDRRIPEEAVIGLTFAVASAGTILVSAENPHGAEHLRDIMAGSILVVSGAELTHAALLYAGVGAFHYVFRRQLLAVSMDRESAARQGLRVRLWDLLFYLSFAAVITSSVRIAGVLLVFVLLIAPALCAAMTADRLGARLAVGWASGIVSTLLGLWLSARMDWPPAPAISCVFAAVLLGVSAARALVRSARPARLVGRFAAVGSVFLLGGWGLHTALSSGAGKAEARAENEVTTEIEAALHTHGEPEHEHGSSRTDLLAALSDEHDNVRARAVEQLGRLREPELVPALIRALDDSSDAVKEKAAEALGSLGRAEAAPALRAALERPDQDEWVTLREAEALARCGGGEGVTALLRLARGADAALVRRQALERALSFAGQPPLGTDDDAAAESALQQLEALWAAERERAHWEPALGRFMFPR